jgi:hypothetical protein
MTTEKAKELIDRAKLFIGQELEIKTSDKASGQFITTNYRFIDTAAFTWAVQNENPTVDLWAKLETIDGSNRITIGLEKIVRHFEGKQLNTTKMKYKEIPITLNTITQSVYVTAVPATNKSTGKQGFLSCTFKVADGEPSDPKKGEEISNILYETEAEAISEGTKILKEKIKQAINLNKKK